MKPTKLITNQLGTCLLAALISACGGIKVGADQETIDAALCIANPETCTEDDEDGNEADDDESASSDYGDASDSSGGIDYQPPRAQGGSDRYFMGTYEISSSGYPLSCTHSYGNGYDFPATIRPYSYGDQIDFEDTHGNIAWVARIYPDDTFDFNVQFLDSFGRPSNDVACTCDITLPYYNGKERISCSCDPSYAGDEVCSLTYDQM